MMNNILDSDPPSEAGGVCALSFVWDDSNLLRQNTGALKNMVNERVKKGIYPDTRILDIHNVYVRLMSALFLAHIPQNID